jgi:hypothetical protein
MRTVLLFRENACKVVSFLTLFVLASTVLQPCFDHLSYSLRTAIMLHLLYAALFTLRTTMHACSNVTSMSNPTIIARNTCDLCAGENCKVARARDVAACMHGSLSNMRTFV